MAQEPGRTYRLGVVSAIPCETPVYVALYDGLRRYGFTKGQNLTVACRFDVTSEYAAELVKAQVDVIFTGGDRGFRAVQEATKTIPILAITDDMVASGFVGSLARPNGNMTGVSILATELDSKRQEILIEAVPGLRRMAVLADFKNSAVAKLDELQEAARARNVELSIHRVASGDEIAAAIDMAKSSGAMALNVLSSPMRGPVCGRAAWRRAS